MANWKSRQERVVKISKAESSTLRFWVSLRREHGRQAVERLKGAAHPRIRLPNNRENKRNHQGS